MIKAVGLDLLGAVTDPFVRVELTCGGKKLKKKRTSTKKATSNPTWNEALVFNLHGRDPVTSNAAAAAVGRDLSLAGVSVELVVLSDGLLGPSEPLGRVLIGDQASGGGGGGELSHWQELVANRNAPARWHTLHAVVASVSE